jgi:hypothetical protein
LKDHDGDTGSADIAMGDESKAETRAYLDDINSAISNNKIKAAFSTDLAQWCLASMSNPS